MPMDRWRGREGTDAAPAIRPPRAHVRRGAGGLHLLASACTVVAVLCACSPPRDRPAAPVDQVIEPDQAHVPAAYRCPAVVVPAAQVAQIADAQAQASRAIEAMVADGVIDTDPERMAAKARGEPARFSMGGHRFRIPLHYFNWHNAPAQGPEDIRLSVQWPCLEPLPLGHDYAQTRDTSLRAITITLTHLPPDAPVSLAQAMDNQVASRVFQGNPLHQLSLRIPGTPVHGLVPYHADLDAVAAHYQASHGAMPESGTLLRISDDWYVRRDADGTRVATVIKCSNHRLPDGAVVDGNTVRRSGPGEPLAWCRHGFTLDQFGVLAWASYPRAYLGHWERIEQRVRSLLREGLIH